MGASGRLVGAGRPLFIQADQDFSPGQSPVYRWKKRSRMLERWRRGLETWPLRKDVFALGGVTDKGGVMGDNEIFRHVWMTAGSSELWCEPGEDHSTYRPIAGHLLPRISAEDLQDHGPWINPETREEADLLEPHTLLAIGEQGTADVDEMDAKASALGLALPAMLVRLFKEEALQRRIPSCTACYLELSSEIVAVPEVPGSGAPGYLLRFLHDSQCCVIWYVWLRPGQPAQVIASHYFFEREYFDALQDVEEPVEYETIFGEAVLCAHSVEEFLYRFWIENLIWFAQHRQKPLSLAMGRYLSTALANQRAVGSAGED